MSFFTYPAYEPINRLRLERPVLVKRADEWWVYDPELSKFVKVLRELNYEPTPLSLKYPLSSEAFNVSGRGGEKHYPLWNASHLLEIYFDSVSQSGDGFRKFHHNGRTLHLELPDTQERFDTNGKPPVDGILTYPNGDKYLIRWDF